MRELVQRLSSLADDSDTYAAEFVDLLLDAARSLGASDAHLQPVPAGLEIRLRVDGVLQTAGVFSPGRKTRVITRLKVLARLLTYRHDTPQEGRIPAEQGLEMRVATFPTLYGERATVRLFQGAGLLDVEQLGYPEDASRELRRCLQETSGAVLFSGPAGSGKSTSAYACLRAITADQVDHRAVMTLEDPVEMAVAGVVQADVSAQGAVTLADGIRSLLRQDPEVIMIGEIRDRDTAQAAFSAALTGHLLLTTFHAGSSTGTIERLMDMAIEPYLIRGSVLAIFHQRLLRRLCDCAEQGADEADKLGLRVDRFRISAGCPACGGLGYRGRGILVEWLSPQRHGLERSLLTRGDARSMRDAARQAGLTSLLQRAETAVQQGWTSPLEARRVLGSAAGEWT